MFCRKNIKKTLCAMLASVFVSAIFITPAYAAEIATNDASRITTDSTDPSGEIQFNGSYVLFLKQAEYFLDSYSLSSSSNITIHFFNADGTLKSTDIFRGGGLSLGNVAYMEGADPAGYIVFVGSGRLTTGFSVH